MPLNGKRMIYALAYARRIRRSRQNPTPARPAIIIASVHGEIGAPAVTTAPDAIVIVKSPLALAAGLPLCARPRRRAAAWPSWPLKLGSGVESETATVKLYVPAAWGVPEIVIGPEVAVLGLKSNPPGSAPAVME